jgi:hypothetical protein
MLVTERTSDGRTVVRLHKDWHPGRIGSAYTPPRKNYEASLDASRIQAALLRSKHGRR